MSFVQLLKKQAFKVFSGDWTKEENETFISLIETNPGCSLVDLGSGEGRLTKLFAKKAKATKVVGVEGGPLPKGKSAITFVRSDINHKLPFKNGQFDVVISHFSLEHLYNTGLFLQESRRILKKGGYMLIATDNLANWMNVAALIMGWQPFVSTYGVSSRMLGNPMAVGGSFIVKDLSLLGLLSHNKVLSYQMIIDALKEYGFEVEDVRGIGYLIFGGWISKLLCRLDVRHSHLLIAKARKN